MTNKIKKIIVGVVVSVVGAGGALTYPLDPSPITIQEYRALIEIYDYEIKQQGEIVLENVTRETVQEKFHKKIRERQLSAEEGVEYEDMREVLLQKVEKTTLFKKIVQ